MKPQFFKLSIITARVAILALFVVGTNAFAESRTQTISGLSARAMFAELSRHENIQSTDGFQSVKSNGIVCVAKNVTEKTEYVCLISEDGVSTPNYTAQLTPSAEPAQY